MKIPVTDELREICRTIDAEKKTDKDWSLIESCDMFQGQNFHGGYEAIEQAFGFSFYAADRSEFWFQLTLDEVHQIAAGSDLSIEGRTADS